MLGNVEKIMHQERKVAIPSQGGDIVYSRPFAGPGSHFFSWSVLYFLQRVNIKPYFADGKMCQFFSAQ